MEMALIFVILYSYASLTGFLVNFTITFTH